MIHSISIAPDKVLEVSDDDVTLDTYCGDVSCSPSTLCDACIALKSCDACGAPATVMVPDGTPSKLPLCADCAICEDCNGTGEREVYDRETYSDVMIVCGCRS